MKDFGIYMIITNPLLSYEEIAEICVSERIKMLQLREKNKSDRELISIGEKIHKITEETETNFIINDRADIAHIIGAEGYHLGQDDAPIDAIRKAFPFKNKIYGLSTHNLSQLQVALTHKPHYVGFGPVYKTPTKKKPDPVIGIDLLKQALMIADVPVVAIGGIDESNIEDVLKAGAKNVALVRHFMQTKQLRSKINNIKQIMKPYTEE